MSTDKLEFKIIKDAQGNDIHLDAMSVEASRSLIVILEALANIVSLTPNNDGIKLQIVKGSATIAAEGSTQQINSFQSDFNQVLERTAVNKDLVSNWKNIQNLFLANGLQYEANFYQSATKTSIASEIKKAKQFRVAYNRGTSDYELIFVSSKLIAIGGKDPNIHLIDGSENKITVGCAETDAIKVNKFLYRSVNLSIWKRQIKGKKAEYKFCDFYNDANHYNDFKLFFQNTRDLSLKDYLFELHYKIKSYLDANELGLLKKFVRLFNHTSVDVNILKTILIITKAFKDHEEIKDLRISLKQIIEFEIGGKLI